VIVEDVQDVAPVFTMAPPVTRLPSGLIPGDKVITDYLHIHAEHSLLFSFHVTFNFSYSYITFLYFILKILQVHAEDGDKGVPREIRYGLVSEGNPFTSFFDINDTTGKCDKFKLFS
jgi:hypothetical protein